jgi:nucleotide-binding universal stress UspA family protein
MQPVLVPLDGSKGAENALPFAAMMHRVYGAPLHFVQVINSGDGGLSASEVAHANELFANYGKDLVKRLQLAPADCRFQVFTGSPAATLLDLAANCQVVVLATHGRGGFRALVLGSVADKVVRAARVPVLMVPAIGAPAPEPRTVLVTLDGSEEAERALVPARTIARALGAKVILFRAFHFFQYVGSEFVVMPPDTIEGLETESVEYLAKVVQPGEETVIFQGDAAQSVVDAAARIDAGLVVMTKSGKGRAERIALGSTTDRVLHSLHRPILVIPPEG